MNVEDVKLLEYCAMYSRRKHRCLSVTYSGRKITANFVHRYKLWRTRPGFETREMRS